MFGISFYELIIVLIVFVILFKPNEVTSILFKLGKVVRNIKAFSADIQAKIEEFTVLGNPNDYSLKEQKKIEKDTTTIKTEVKKTKADNKN